MQSKKLIFNSDDFGYSHSFNEGIKRGFLAGVLSSTCILANGEAFEEAVNIVKNEIPQIGLGVHLNIIEGKSITNCPLLTDDLGIFNNGFIEMLLKSNNKIYMSQIEQEFRAQIEKIINETAVDHINSHVHTHGIPAIFDLTARLANEYGIKAIRTQYEKPYVIPKLQKHLSTKYPVNLIKNILLNTFSIRNKIIAKKHSLLTNEYLLGVTYTGYMDEDAIVYGLKAINKKETLSEILIHPTYFEPQNIEKPFNYGEFLITQSPTIKDEIFNLQNWDLTNYKEILNTKELHSQCCH